MPEPKTTPNRSTERLLKQVLHRRFTFQESQGDLELLRSIHDGSYADMKPGDPSFHAYAAAINVANEFAAQVLDMQDLLRFNDQLADVQEEHMPSYPPMSPVTSAFFAGWVVLDARDDATGITLGEVLVHYLKRQDEFDYVQKAMAALNVSFCSFYEVIDVDAEGLTLWDTAAKQELPCWCSSGYRGRKGEIWYVRVLPPFVQGLTRSVTMNTPYVLTDSFRLIWEEFFQRHQGSEAAPGRSLQEYLKNGKWLGYWLEFISQAYADHTGNMIRITGVPDDPASLPHADPKRQL